MVLVLSIGDANVPFRSSAIPQKLRALLQPGKIHQILCTGNICDQDTLDFLRSVTSNIVVSQGDYDEMTSWPETPVLTLGDFKVGVCHGHQVVPTDDKRSIAELQRRLGVEILVKGNAAEFGAYRHEGCIVIHPGSATGTGLHGRKRHKASFALMDIKGSKAIVYVYQLDINDEVKVEKIEFSKGQ
eukprot:jgi/Picsp_1/2647/NSC_00877-R1_vacuolar protein sorting 29 protein